MKIMKLRNNEKVKLWIYETMKHWNSGIMELWKLWYRDIKKLCEAWNWNFENYETVKLWNLRIMDCQTIFFDVISNMKKIWKMSPNGTFTRQSSEMTRPSTDYQAHICMYIIMNKREKEKERKTEKVSPLRFIQTPPCCAVGRFISRRRRVPVKAGSCRCVSVVPRVGDRQEQLVYEYCQSSHRQVEFMLCGLYL